MRNRRHVTDRGDLEAHRLERPDGRLAAGARPAVINLQLSISGGYFQVVDFVNRLDGLSRQAAAALAANDDTAMRAR